MNYFKKLPLIIFAVCNGVLYASDPVIAKSPYSKEAAAIDLTLAGYNIAGKELVMRGNPETGANFVDVILPMADARTGASVETRAICYGPGRYVLAHSHNEDELFHVTRGACALWTLEPKGASVPSWVHSTAKTADIIKIPAGVIHCLLASSQGLCMHVPWDDRTRSVDFVPTVKAPFEADIDLSARK